MHGHEDHSGYSVETGLAGHVCMGSQPAEGCCAGPGKCNGGLTEIATVVVHRKRTGWIGESFSNKINRTWGGSDLRREGKDVKNDTVSYLYKSTR